MESFQLFYFKAIAQAESLTKAAQQLHISQPALSKNLSNLEKELGRSLFNRVNGRLYLNEDGRALLEYANQVDNIFQQIRDYFSRQPVHPDQLTMVSVGNYFSFLMRSYFHFDTRPLSLKVLPDAKIPEALFSGEADVAIADDRYLQPNPEQGLKRIPVLSEQLLLMIPHGHPLEGKRSVSMGELSGQPIMRLNSNLWLEDVARVNRMDLRKSWSVDSETWNLYWSSCGEQLPLCFDTSASFTTRDMLKAQKRRCSIARVEGIGTNRMLHLWYFKQNEERLARFLDCVRASFQ